MSVVETLFSIARGDRPEGNLVPSCRLEMSGAEFYGEEAIVSAFRKSGLRVSGNADIIKSASNIAIFDGEVVLFADILNDNICRIWCLSNGELIEAEPAIGVPFDPDMNQKRGDVIVSPSDYPELDEEVLQHVETIGREISHGGTAGKNEPDYRIRAFLIRAFNNGNHGAALFAVHRLSSGTVRTAGFSYVAARFQTDGKDLAGHSVVQDESGKMAVESKPWRSRVE
jgi:hypothetical protein